MFKGLANPGDTGEHKLWGKCTISIECKTDILVVLMVISGLDPHMIIELEDDLNRCLFMLEMITYDIVVTLLLLGLMV